MKTVWKSNVRIHDLRHTFASHLVSRGASLQLVGSLLGHTQAATTQRYAHCAPEALRNVANSFPDDHGHASRWDPEERDN